MAIDLRSPSTLTSSLNDQIREAERRLQNRRRLVRIRGAALGRTLRQRITGPTGLLWAGGVGFLVGELTPRPAPQARGADHSLELELPFFETALNLIKLTSWARTLFTALLDAEPPHCDLRSNPTCDPSPSPENVH